MNKEELQNRLRDLHWLHDNIDFDRISIEYDYEGWVNCVYPHKTEGPISVGDEGELETLVTLSKALQRLQVPEITITVTYHDGNGHKRIKQGKHCLESFTGTLWGWAVDAVARADQRLPDGSMSVCDIFLKHEDLVGDLRYELAHETIETEHGYYDDIVHVYEVRVVTAHGRFVAYQPIDNVLSYLRGEEDPWKTT